MGYNLSELIEYVNTLTPSRWSADRYRNYAGNRIMRMDSYVIQTLFGRPMPFHIYHSTDRASVDTERERMITFCIMWDQLRSVPELAEYRRTFENWDFPDQEETFKKLKDISKNLRISEDRIDIQMLSQLHMDTRFKFENDEAEDAYKRQYFNHYISDEKEDVVLIADKYVFLACKKMAHYIDRLIPDWVDHWDTTLPVVQDKYSPIGPKSEDQKYLVKALCTGQKVSSYVDKNIQLLKQAMIALGMEMPDFDYIVSDDQETILKSIVLLIRVNAIETQAGKPRTVFQSNDWYDVVLCPFYRFLKKVCSCFQCSFSTYKADANSDSNSKYAIARLASSNALDLMNSHSSNSDLSSATDKLHGTAQKELFMYFYDYLSFESKEALSSIGLNRDYFSSAIDILNYSYVYTEFHNGEIIIGVPRFGQLQGLRGSFHLLHWNNMLFGLAAFLKEGYTLHEWDISSLYNGDDAILPDKVMNSYKQYWLDNSDTEVVSIDKSTSEEVIGALQFCKEFVKTGKKSPRIINGLKPNQLVRIFSDPEQMLAFTRCDMYHRHQVMRLTEFMFNLQNKYKEFGFLSELVADDYTSSYISRTDRFRTATNYLLYQEIRDMFTDSTPTVKTEARFGLTSQMTPLNRAKTYMIDNSFISFDQLLNLYELRKFSTIITEDASIWNPNSRCYSFLNHIKDDFIRKGIIPEYDGTIERYQYLGVKQILMGLGIMDPEAFLGFSANSLIPKVYELTYSGYQSTNHVIRCKMTLE